MSFLDQIALCNAWRPNDYVPFLIGGTELGWVRHDFKERLSAYEDVFVVSEAAVALAERLETFAVRTEAVDRALRELAAEGHVRGWRDEPYPVGTAFAAPPLMEMERAAVPLFGVLGFGVHVNGIVREADETKLWVARRSPKKQTAPGKLDHIVAGGQPAGLSIRENLVKECAEEADIPPALAGRAVPVGTVSYCTERPEGLRRDVLFCYDLELPADFRPRNADGEIDYFELWPIERVIATVRDTQEFKFNCNLVIIDLLVRRGFITPDEPGYVEIVEGLRR